MGSRSLSQLTIVVLLLVGAAGIALRSAGLQAEKRAREDSLWQLSYDVAFKATGDATSVHIALPASNDHVQIRPDDDEEFVTGDLVQEVQLRRPSGTRELIVRTNRFSTETLHATAEFVLRMRPDGGWGEAPLMSLSGDAKARYLQAEPTIFPKGNPEVRALISRARTETETDEELVQWIFEYCSRTLRAAPANHSDDVLGVLLDKAATPLGRARMMVTLCRAAEFPARIVTGFELRQQAPLRPHSWVEVFRDAAWRPFDPEYGYARRLPEHFVAARLGGEQIVYSDKAEQAEELKARYSLVRLSPDVSLFENASRHPTQVLNLTRLPVEMHEVLSLLLLLPLGALITAFFRNIVGIPTFGTFAPALFAVSFIYADWGSGIVILIVVFAAGLLGRAAVDRLRLLMVPRLSILLTTIILCVVFCVSALDYMDLTPSAKAVLLPLVIVTLLIERFYVTTEEDGPAYAMQLTAGTIAVGAACFFVLSWDEVGAAILVYPEFHLITIALFIAIGRYAGYRIVELWRFRDLARPKQQPSPLDQQLTTSGKREP